MRSVPSLAVVLAACSAGEPAARAPEWRAPDAALEEACRACHPEIVTDWSRTGMARALGPVFPEELVGLSPVVEPATGLRYELVESGDGGAIVETLGEKHRFEGELVFAIGAGELDRSYAARVGALAWFAPLEVVRTEDGRRAALAPGHAIHPGTRFRTAITPECLGCHTDTPPPRTFPLNRIPDVFEPRGISCAACHGSTEAHARWQESDLAGEDPSGSDPVLRPETLSREKRLSVCAACHLQGDARIVLDPAELGPPPPGRDVLEQRAVFVAREPTQDVGFVSQVERLVLSRCYTESDDLVCGTCHDPHRSLHDDEERRRVRDACATCHASEECSLDPARRRAADCASCHMRRTGVFDVDAVEIHDHFIRTDPGAPSPRVPLRLAEAPDGDWRRFAWPGVEPPEHVDDPGLWMMASAHGEHFERAVELVDATPGPASATLPMYHHVRGMLLEALGRTEDAIGSYERALELDPDLAPSAVNLGLLLGRTGRIEEGIARLTDVLARHPESDGALSNRAVLRADLGDFDGMAADLQAAMAISPRPALAKTLASYYEQRGDRDAALRWRRLALELEPLR